MEIANPDTLVVRPANQSDAGRITRLLRSAAHTHAHADWHLPADWLGSPGFVLVEENSEGGELLACLAVGADPLPAAWVRIAAVRYISQIRALLPVMFKQAMNHLRSIGASQLAWLVVEGWPDKWLPALGFERANWITTYAKHDLAKQNTVENNSSFVTRSVQMEEMDRLAEIEAQAFAPLWRHSASGLNTAYHQSISFDVILQEGKIIGFQYSVPGQGWDSAHLVRITITPEAQGIGAGSTLLAATLAGYRRLGLKRVSLNTQLDNIRSHRLYERFGFYQIGDQLPVWAVTI